ncbi:MAG: outer membrane lipoprotein-sorting protein [candidate division KSB1 bacterium]|nr:outer membrane lipoprotein-sorting protein [candidate division KSB1 bacterium]
MVTHRRAMLFVLGVLIYGHAFPQSPEEIVRRAEEAIKGKTCHGLFTMKVATPDFQRTLRMESWWVGNEKALITILAPAREAGNRTLKVGREIWMYLRNTETTIKIPPSMMLQSWNGSDYTYDDLVRESDLVRDYHISIAGNDTLDGVATWKLALLPRPEAPVVWGKVLYWVRKPDYLPARVEYFDEEGELVRTMIFQEFKALGGRKIPSRWTMRNQRKPGHYTEITIESIEFDIRIPDRVFSFRELER